MKSLNPLLLIGIVVLLVSGYVLVEGGALTTRRDVIAIGDLKVSAETEHPVRPWMAGAGLALGATLILFGATQKR
jgi:hypothetical protein